MYARSVHYASGRVNNGLTSATQLKQASQALEVTDGATQENHDTGRVAVVRYPVHKKAA